jgi:peptidoglycan/xylan/chitin deacetylase (PgdA/CDA1 family)
MPERRLAGALAGLALLAAPGAPAEPARPAWPGGARAALSLSFDDGRTSQVDVGLPLLDSLGAKVTFYLVPSAVEPRLDGWKRAAAAGHEIANHTLTHPCSGNFPWARAKALEDYTLERMRGELVDANRRLQELLGVAPETFAYPCGQTFVGRGTQAKSYVPLVAELFVAGRGWLAESPNDPAYCDLAQLMGMEMDGKEFEQILPLLDQARETGGWLVLGGHEIGPEGRQTTRVSLLRRLIPYARDPAHGIWLAPVATAARHVRSFQQKGDSR